MESVPPINRFLRVNHDHEIITLDPNPDRFLAPGTFNFVHPCGFTGFFLLVKQTCMFMVYVPPIYGEFGDYLLFLK